MEKKFENIFIGIEHGIAMLVFNRPDQLNAMNRQMMDEIIEAIQAINNKDEVKLALIRGEGRAFMAGADIKAYGNQTPEEFDAFQKKGKLLYESIENSSKPWIAAVNGYALGGGFEIALSCDMILASEQASMGLPEVFLSLVPGGGGTQRLIQKIGINRAKEMLFMGTSFPAKQLYDWGIVNRVFDEADFMKQTIDFAKKLSRRPSASIAQLKRLAQLSLTEMPFDQRIDNEAQTVKELFLGEEAQKAIQDFIHKNK